MNQKFDSSCKVSVATPLSFSERACAASHLKVWRSIAISNGILNKNHDTGTEIDSSLSASSIPCSDIHQLLHNLSTSERNDNSLFLKSENMNSIHRKQVKYFLIFEDDATIKSSINTKYGDFRCYIHHIVNHAPRDWDIIYLGIYLYMHL